MAEPREVGFLVQDAKARQKAHEAALAALSPLEREVLDMLPYSTIPDPEDAKAIVALVRAAVLTEYLEAQAARFRYFAEVGICDWGLVVESLEAMIEDVKREAGDD